MAFPVNLSFSLNSGSENLIYKPVAIMIILIRCQSGRKTRHLGLPKNFALPGLIALIIALRKVRLVVLND